MHTPLGVVVPRAPLRNTSVSRRDNVRKPQPLKAFSLFALVASVLGISPMRWSSSWRHGYPYTKRPMPLLSVSSVTKVVVDSARVRDAFRKTTGNSMRDGTQKEKGTGRRKRRISQEMRRGCEKSAVPLRTLKAQLEVSFL